MKKQKHLRLTVINELASEIKNALQLNKTPLNFFSESGKHLYEI